MEEELHGSRRAKELFSEFKWSVKSAIRKLPRCDDSSEYSTYGLALTDIKQMFQLCQSKFFEGIESPPLSFTESD